MDLFQAAINRDFGSVEAMKEKLSAATVGVQGSGWGWLGLNKASGRLQIATCANQVYLKDARSSSQGSTAQIHSKIQ